MKKNSPPATVSAASIAPPLGLLAAALRAQSEGVFIAEIACAAEGLQIIFVNDSLCAITGYGSPQLIGHAHGLLHADRVDLDRLVRWIPTARPGQPLLGEGYLRRADGHSIYAAWSFDPVSDEAGCVTHIVAAYRDTTEKRRLQEALVHAQRLDAVGRLAGGVAHDFNNLLSVINGYCEVLATKLAGQPTGLDEINAIHTAGRQGAALAQQLLVFGRRQALHPQVINLNTLVRDHAAILGRLVGDSGRLELELSEEPLHVRVDPAQFTQVLLNLVLNARDALRDHGRITVVTESRTLPTEKNRRQTDLPPGDYALLSVRDNGTGMDAATQLQLFEPFFTTKPVGKGTGLGLALVYRVVQQSGGQITVQSELLVGTSFDILLPRDNAPAEPSVPSPAVTPLPFTRGSERVLLLEADDVVRKMVAGILTADGYRVYAGSTAAETLSLAKEATQPIQLFIAPLAEAEAGAVARALLARRAETRLLDVGPTDANPPFAALPENQISRLPKPFALSQLLKASRLLLDN
ncbi:MAG: PAS domain S-box protein [Undibacterium sp.]|nr:PAS domain S-box protein [Opitutaceae bacterium]